MMMIGVVRETRLHKAAFNCAPVETVTTAPPAPPVTPAYAAKPSILAGRTWATSLLALEDASLEDESLEDESLEAEEGSLEEGALDESALLSEDELLSTPAPLELCAELEPSASALLLAGELEAILNAALETAAA